MRIMQTLVPLKPMLASIELIFWFALLTLAAISVLVMYKVLMKNDSPILKLKILKIKNEKAVSKSLNSCYFLN
jgi:hypothetical protein